ncbi:hypothetical protein KO498_05015 [Lentibacter algarum]|uniref:hypothetical protein n=1 Tax=Lentibacter algarum TaxID=576131 RepID=UPI001C066451|nr:hypothetical protein [Lentibacter algarum]MBU2981169.1 hypothetical protein [Lentibacter algarum]
MTESTENPTFIRGDFTPVAELLEIALSGVNENYEPEFDAEQVEELVYERGRIFDNASQIAFFPLHEVIPQEAMREKAQIFRQVNDKNFFDGGEVSFVINPSKRKKGVAIEKTSNSEIVDSVIEKMCSAMKAAGVNNQTISTVRATTKISIENSLANGDEVPAIPSVAPRKYRGVIQDGPPVEFIRSVYAKWVIAEVLDREALDKLDHNLVLAVYSYKKRNPKAPTLKDVLASKSAADSNRRKIYNQAQNFSIVN